MFLDMLMNYWASDREYQAGNVEFDVNKLSESAQKEVLGNRYISLEGFNLWRRTVGKDNIEIHDRVWDETIGATNKGGFKEVMNRVNFKEAVEKAIATAKKEAEEPITYTQLREVYMDDGISHYEAVTIAKDIVKDEDIAISGLGAIPEKHRKAVIDAWKTKIKENIKAKEDAAKKLNQEQFNQALAPLFLRINETIGFSEAHEIIDGNSSRYCDKISFDDPDRDEIIEKLKEAIDEYDGD